MAPVGSRVRPRVGEDGKGGKGGERRDAPARDGGSAVAEFTLASALVVVVVLALAQLAFALWVRTVLTDAAAEGARLGALAGGSDERAGDRARELVRATLGSAYAPSVTVTDGPAALGVPGYDVVVVELTAPLPVLGLIGPERSLTVTGRAVRER